MRSIKWIMMGLAALAAGAVAMADGVTIPSSTGTATFGALIVTGASTQAVVTVTGYESSDARLVLDADQGDDNADTWTIESEAADNDLSFVNHTTEQFTVTTAGDAKATGDLHALGGEVYIGTTGYLGIRNTTQLVFVASGVTNVLDADITN
jgi:hypothetical protein